MLLPMKHYLVATVLVSTSFIALTGANAQTSVHAQTNKPAPRHAQPYKPRLVEIRMDDDFKPKMRTALGKLQGYDPIVTVVHRGDRIRFVNVDDIQHTATGYAFGGQTIPAHYKFQGDPSTQHGSEINRSEWSTGNVGAHTRSTIFQIRTTGTFYFADGYHPTEMRGAIIVK